MNECEHVIVLDVCCTIKRPTEMCLAKKKKKKKATKMKNKNSCYDKFPRGKGSGWSGVGGKEVVMGFRFKVRDICGRAEAFSSATQVGANE